MHACTEGSEMAGERKRAPIRAKLGLRSTATGDDREKGVVAGETLRGTSPHPTPPRPPLVTSLHYATASTSISRVCILHYVVGFMRLILEDV